MIRVRSLGRSCGRSGRKTSPLHLPIRKKNRLALGQAILVASEAAPGLFAGCLGGKGLSA